MMRQLRFPTGDIWHEVKDGNDTARRIFDGHYSRIRYADGRRPALFVGRSASTALSSGMRADT